MLMTSTTRREIRKWTQTQTKTKRKFGATSRYAASQGCRSGRPAGKNPDGSLAKVMETAWATAET